MFGIIKASQASHNLLEVEEDLTSTIGKKVRVDCHSDAWRTSKKVTCIALGYIAMAIFWKTGVFEAAKIPMSSRQIKNAAVGAAIALYDLSLIDDALRRHASFVNYASRLVNDEIYTNARQQNSELIGGLVNLYTHLNNQRVRIYQSNQQANVHYYQTHELYSKAK